MKVLIDCRRSCGELTRNTHKTVKVFPSPLITHTSSVYTLSLLPSLRDTCICTQTHTHTLDKHTCLDSLCCLCALHSANSSIPLLTHTYTHTVCIPIPGPQDWTQQASYPPTPPQNTRHLLSCQSSYPHRRTNTYTTVSHQVIDRHLQKLGVIEL